MVHSDDIPSSGSADRSTFWRTFFGTDLLPLAIIVVFVIVLMWPFTIQGRALMPDTWKSIHPWARGVDLEGWQANVYDTVLEYGPWYEYSQTCLKEGRVPHWNPWQFCGAPLYANRLIPFFYPPFVLAEIIAAPHKIIGWFQLFNLILSGWGMYFLLRRWSMTRAIATAGSLLWLTCGVHFLPFPLWTLGTIGFPWLLWALEGFLEKPGLRPIAVAAFVAGLILMTGYPVLVVHLTYFTALYFICRWWTTRRIGPGRLHWSIPLIVLLSVYILGFGLSAISNVPAWNYSSQTVRHIEGFTDKAFEREKLALITPAEEAGLDPITARFGERADILFPINGRGTQRAWQYGGVLVYLLAFLGILAGRPQARILGVLGLIFAIPVWIPEVYVSMTGVLPGWALTILLPIEAVNLIAYLLAACGIEALIDTRRSPNLYGKALFALLAVAAIAVTARILHHAPVIDLPILLDVPESNLLSYSPFHVFYLAAFAALALGVAALVFVRRKVVALRWLFLLASIAFSLVTFEYLQPVYSQPDYTPETPFTDWIRKAAMPENPAEGNRLARWANLPLPFDPGKRAKSPLTPNLHLIYGVEDVGGYDSLVPARFINYCSLFEDPFIDYRALIAFAAPSTMQHPRFRAMGVRWILSQGELPLEAEDGCSLAWDDRRDGSRQGTDRSDDFIQVWEVYQPSPRAFLTRRIAYASDPADNPLVQAENWRARGIDAIVVEDPERENRTLAFPNDPLDPDSPVLDGSEVVFLRDQPERVVLQVQAPTDCYLVLRDGWNPEWSATVDGKPARIRPADGAFRAVEIQAGTHAVEFRYIPRSFRRGVWITCISLLVIVGLYSVTGGRTRYKSPTPSNR